MVRRRKEAKKAKEIVKEEVQEFVRKMEKRGWNKNRVLV